MTLVGKGASFAANVLTWIFARCAAVLQALAAHLINLWDKSLLFRSCATQSGCSGPHQFLLLLGIRASCRLSLPVLKENLSRVLRGAGGSGGTGLGATIHLTSAEDVPENDSDAVGGCNAVCCVCG